MKCKQIKIAILFQIKTYPVNTQKERVRGIYKLMGTKNIF